MAWEIVRALGSLAVLALCVGWLANLVRGRTTVRASFYDEHGLRPLPAAVCALAVLVTLAAVLALVAG